MIIIGIGIVVVGALLAYGLGTATRRDNPYRRF